jgi:hypothetical protein
LLCSSCIHESSCIKLPKKKNCPCAPNMSQKLLWMSLEKPSWRTLFVIMTSRTSHLASIFCTDWFM